MTMFKNITKTKIISVSLLATTAFILATVSCAAQYPPAIPTKALRNTSHSENKSPNLSKNRQKLQKIIQSNFERYTAPEGSIIFKNKYFRVSPYLKLLYIKNGYYPLWLSSSKDISSSMKSLPLLIKLAHKEGLNPDYYHHDLIESIIKELTKRKNKYTLTHIAALDLFLSNVVLQIASDLYYGRYNALANINEIERSDYLDLAEVVKSSIKENTLTNLPNLLTPQSPIYTSLKKHLENYRKIKESGGWPRIPITNSKLTIGKRDPRVLLVKERLFITGDLKLKTDPETGYPWDSLYMNDDLFDETLFEAVKRFQKRHQLKIDGVIGPNTIRAMNISVEQKIKTIELNLDLWRKLPRNLGKRYIIVNIPGFHLYAFENNKIVTDMKVVVGKQEWNTPIFNDYMTYIVVNPHWNIPDSIFKDEILPELKKDPTYLERKNIKVITGWEKEDLYIDPQLIDWENFDFSTWNIRLRQEPGEKNPLGRLKFMFPNKYNVYLHDTPMKSLFNKNSREFSHGCIRVEKPLELVKFVLNNDSYWTIEKILEEIESGETKNVPLPEAIPIYILYFTAWPEKDGTISFANDIYNLIRI